MPLYQDMPSLFGLTDLHVIETEEGKLHPLASEAFDELKEKAKAYNIQLSAVSTYRNFEDQKRIWNLKASGKRTLLDDDGTPLQYEELSETDIVWSILRWSAFPGLSRHHWGTEIDVIDEKALESDPQYKVQLVPEEYGDNGIFKNLGLFLDGPDLKGCGFFRPYRFDLDGVAMEPWHISMIEVAQDNFKSLLLEDVLAFVEGHHCDDIFLIDLVRTNIEQIYQQFVANITLP